MGLTAQLGAPYPGLKGVDAFSYLVCVLSAINHRAYIRAEVVRKKTRPVCITKVSCYPDKIRRTCGFGLINPVTNDSFAPGATDG